MESELLTPPLIPTYYLLYSTVESYVPRLFAECIIQLLSFSVHADSSVCSADYAVPPDASEQQHPQYHQQSFFDSPARRSTGSGNSAATAEKALERSGYLAKLGGRIKTWRRRYFVLKNGTLSYWKSQVS